MNATGAIKIIKAHHHNSSKSNSTIMCDLGHQRAYQNVATELPQCVAITCSSSSFSCILRSKISIGKSKL
jgi:hypothetical protein